MTSDIRDRTKLAVGMRSAALSMRGEKCGVTARLLRDGQADGQATRQARKWASWTGHGEMLRSGLGRMRSGPQELMRRRHSDEIDTLRSVFRGEAKAWCACGARTRETRVHWRTGCELSRPARASIEIPVWG